MVKTKERKNNNNNKNISVDDKEAIHTHNGGYRQSFSGLSSWLDLAYTINFFNGFSPVVEPLSSRYYKNKTGCQFRGTFT